MEYFAILTGVITIAGFFIQIRGFFPNYKDEIAKGVILVLGVFVGLLFSFISPLSINLSLKIHPFSYFVLALTGFVFVFSARVAFVLTFTSKNEDRPHFEDMLKRSGLIFFVLLIFLWISFDDGTRELTKVHSKIVTEDRFNLTRGELALLATKAESDNQLERALDFLEELRLREKSSSKHEFRMYAYSNRDRNRTPVENEIERVRLKLTALVQAGQLKKVN